MSEMVERVARAIFAASHPDACWHCHMREFPASAQLLMRQAEAAVLAMREPDDAATKKQAPEPAVFPWHFSIAPPPTFEAPGSIKWVVR